MMPAILVTGGAGFIGSHLCDKLSRMGHLVVCLDRVPNKQPTIVSVIGDVTNKSTLESIHSKFNISQVYHLASPASPIIFDVDPVGVLLTNVVGTSNVLDVFGLSGIRVLLTSTSEIYGEPLTHPQSEQYFGNVNPIGPRACYDEGKRAAEALCVSYNTQHGIDYCITRLFNVYGPGMKDNDGRAVPSFIRAALDNQPITIFGNGNQTRSFVYIDDVTDALIKLMNTSANGPFNIGRSVETSILDLARIVVKITKSASPIIHDVHRIDDPSRRCPNTQKIENTIDWRSTVSLDDGIKLTVDHVMALDRLRLCLM